MGPLRLLWHFEFLFLKEWQQFLRRPNVSWSRSFSSRFLPLISHLWVIPPFISPFLFLVTLVPDPAAVSSFGEPRFWIKRLNLGKISHKFVAARELLWRLKAKATEEKLHFFFFFLFKGQSDLINPGLKARHDCSWQSQSSGPRSGETLLLSELRKSGSSLQLLPKGDCTPTWQEGNFCKSVPLASHPRPSWRLTCRDSFSYRNQIKVQKWTKLRHS